MNEREDVLVNYMAALCLYGEDSQKAQDFAAQYANDESLSAALTNVLILYRVLEREVESI